MDSEMRQLNIFLFPFMAYGHMIPTIHMAKLFASRGAKTAIITTPLNLPFFARTIERSKDLGHEIGIKIIKFPCAEAGLPEGCENLDSITSHINGQEATIKFFAGTRMLKETLEQLLEECRPDCLVADMFFPWATEAAARFGIPRLVFHGTSFFSLCASECMMLHEPHKKVSSDSEPFVVPHLPGDIKLTTKQLGHSERQSEGNVITELLRECKESELKSYGVVLNSFYELEPAYADFYRNHLGKRAWHIGPLSLCNRSIEEKAERGKPSSIDEHECLKWLDSKKPNSVIYVCFGSIANFSAAQLMEIAIGLEASGQQFIWVVRKQKNNGQEEEGWLPEGFEKRMEGKGLIIRGWAPQVLILDHKAVGAFVTHCGWNSILEGVSAGVPMVTWPVAAEQFYNEKLVTQVLKIGVPVGAEKWAIMVGDFVKRDKIEKAVKEITVGDKAEERRSRAKALAEMARRAVENGGSSYSDLDSLIQDLKLVSPLKPISKQRI